MNNNEGVLNKRPSAIVGPVFVGVCVFGSRVDVWVPTLACARALEHPRQAPDPEARSVASHLRRSACAQSSAAWSRAIEMAGVASRRHSPRGLREFDVSGAHVSEFCVVPMNPLLVCGSACSRAARPALIARETTEARKRKKHGLSLSVLARARASNARLDRVSRRTPQSTSGREHRQ